MTPLAGDFLASVPGEMASLIRDFDWSGTSLGAINEWPQSLKTATALIVQCRVPIVMLWGSEGVMIYNDGYTGFARGRHPAALGMKVLEGWAEVADFNSHVMNVGLAGGTLSFKDQELTLNRNGEPEQVWMNLDYSPVLDDSGVPGGVIAIVVETTERVLADRRNAEFLAALGESEARYRTLFESMGEAFCIIESATLPGSGLSDYRYVSTNPAFSTTTGVKDVIGKTIREIFPNESHEWFDTYDRVLASGKPVRFERGLESLGRVLEVYAFRIQDQAHRRVGVIFSDVTARKQAETARRQAENRLRELNMNLEREVVERSAVGGRFWQMCPDLLGVLKPDAIFESVNPAWKAVLGWSEAEVTTTSIFELLHPEDRAHTREGFESLKGGSLILHFENRYLRKDGGFEWFSWSAVPLGDAYYCSGRKITAEKAQAAVLAERTAERELIWRNAQDLIAVIDATGVFQEVSSSCHKILGWKPEELIGRSVFEFIHSDDVASTQTALVHAASAELPTFVNRYRHQDGGYRWLSWVAAPENGLIYATARNITVEREQAQALAETQDALRQAQKMEAVGQLTGGIAHDFNNLLAGISGSLELLEARLAERHLSGFERYIDAAQASAKRAAALTQRLLAFSRRQTLDPRPTDVNRLISGMEELIRRTVGPSIQVEVVGAGGLWLTRIDAGQLESALLNLAINARDAMPDGGRITIETANKWLDERAARQREVPAGQYISVCVTDTGTGMTAAVIERAFDPFFTTKPLGQGTGLGLSMIHGFVRQSGGQVRVYSEVGRGTTMCLYLPRFIGELDAPDASEDQKPSQSGVGEVVLVIDDDPTVRMLIVEVLQEGGYTAIEADDGPSGLKVLQSDAKIDLLVTDVGLPGGMNGRQVADAARTTRADLKVLFVTGYAENAVVGNGILAPGMAVITKPFVMHDLGRKIREMIEP
jgi:PAS domain S-box-containing protein